MYRFLTKTDSTINRSRKFGTSSTKIYTIFNIYKDHSINGLKLLNNIFENVIIDEIFITYLIKMY